MKQPKVKVRFSSNLPTDEREWLLSQSKDFRERYYMQVFNAKKRGNEPMLPRAYYAKNKHTIENTITGLKPFNEIAERMDLTVAQVKEIYESAMLKIKMHFGVALAN